MRIKVCPTTGRNIYPCVRIMSEAEIKEANNKLRSGLFFPKAATWPDNIDEAVEKLKGIWRSVSTAPYCFVDEKGQGYPIEGPCHAAWGYADPKRSNYVGILTHPNTDAASGLSSRAASGLSSHTEEGKLDVDRWVRYLIFDSPYGQVVYWPPGWTIDDMLTKGIPVDGRWKSGFAQCFNVATRYPREYPATVSFWNRMVERGVDPDLAFFVLSSCLINPAYGKGNEGKWQFLNYHGIQGHNIIRPLNEKFVVNHVRRVPANGFEAAEPWIDSPNLYGGSDMFTDRLSKTYDPLGPAGGYGARFMWRMIIRLKGYIIHRNPYSVDAITPGHTLDEFADHFKWEQDYLFNSGLAGVGKMAEDDVFIFRETKNEPKNTIEATKVPVECFAHTLNIGPEKPTFEQWYRWYSPGVLKSDYETLASKLFRILIRSRVKVDPPPLKSAKKKEFAEYCYDQIMANIGKALCWNEPVVSGGRDNIKYVGTARLMKGIN